MLSVGVLILMLETTEENILIGKWNLDHFSGDTTFHSHESRDQTLYVDQ